MTTDGGIVYDNNAYSGSSVTAPAGDARAIRANGRLISGESHGVSLIDTTRISIP
ncbi:MAG: hypothetical protein ABI036_01670 [Fibrobacteria bacterium]